MNCRRAQSEIALWVGNDLDDAAAGKLQRHVSACPRCRDYWQAMTRSIETLQSPLLQTHPASSPGLWPALAPRLAPLQSPAEAGRFNGWVPALATLAACVAIVIFSQDLSTSQQRPGWQNRPINTMPVGDPIWRGWSRPPAQDQWTPERQQLWAPRRTAPGPQPQHPGDPAAGARTGASLSPSAAANETTLNPDPHAFQE